MWLHHRLESTEHIFTPKSAYMKCSKHQNVTFNLKNAKYSTKNLSFPVNLHFRLISKSPILARYARIGLFDINRKISKSPILARYASMFIHDRGYPDPPPKNVHATLE